jgi:tellurite resistance protein TerC
VGIESFWLYAAFVAFILAMLAVDLGVFQRNAHAVSMKEAAIWSGVWIGLSFIFAGVVYFWQGSQLALEFLAGYLIEKALSVDNLFVFLLLFGIFAVPRAYQHRVLFWGVVGALITRGLFILVGSALMARFHWIIYVFGAFLVYTAVKLALGKDTEIHPQNNPVLRIARRYLPVTEGYEKEHFLVRRAGKLWATPLLLVLLVVESTDIVFATDSIPAVFAVSSHPFIVFTSNVFAILGLRALYFLLAGAIEQFHYLKPALSLILGFVGVKMLISEFWKIPIGVSLAVIAGLLTVAIVASLLRARRLSRVETAADTGTRA